MLVQHARDHCRELRIIRCICPDNVARTRIESDLVHAAHSAADRDFRLYIRLQAQADRLEYPHLIVDTAEPLAASITKCLDYLHGPDERVRQYGK